mmetsp:Transcript_76178/g.235194  ORF Transcript_76178/g.235194 Transcript_76178/m.235194 type:complete len:246 (-) Transcript_76178:285-1022(-)
MPRRSTRMPGWTWPGAVARAAKAELASGAARGAPFCGRAAPGAFGGGRTTTGCAFGGGRTIAGRAAAAVKWPGGGGLEAGAAFEKGCHWPTHAEGAGDVELQLCRPGFSGGAVPVCDRRCRALCLRSRPRGGADGGGHGWSFAEPCHAGAPAGKTALEARQAAFGPAATVEAAACFPLGRTADAARKSGGETCLPGPGPKTSAGLAAGPLRGRPMEAPGTAAREVRPSGLGPGELAGMAPRSLHG